MYVFLNQIFLTLYNFFINKVIKKNIKLNKNITRKYYIYPPQCPPPLNPCNISGYLCATKYMLI